MWLFFNPTGGINTGAGRRNRRSVEGRFPHALIGARKIMNPQRSRGAQWHCAGDKLYRDDAETS